MKKLLFIVAIAVALVACNKTDYKAMGERYAARLIDLCQKNDTAAVLALNDSIDMAEQEVAATGDSIQVEAFRKALYDARQQCAAFITVAKIQGGMSKDDAVKDVIQDALNGDGDITAVTSSIQAALEQEAKEGNDAEPAKGN